MRRKQHSSVTVLAYLNNLSLPLVSFERNRVKKILKHTENQQWSYVCSEKNAADLLTKNKDLSLALNWFVLDEDYAKIINKVGNILLGKVLLPWEQEKDFRKKHTNGRPEKFDQVVMDMLLEEQNKIKLKGKKRLNVRKNEKGLLEVLTRGNCPEDKSRILISNNMDIAKILMEYVPIKSGHQGPDIMRHRLRKKFWTIGETALAKRVYESCEECKEWRRNPKFEYPANEIAREQSNGEPIPFESIGLDIMGPFSNKKGGKRNVLVAVCLKTKSIAFELLESIDKTSLQLALLRIRYLRGNPQNIRSDNAPTFANLAKSFQGNWKFNSPKAQYQGGI